MISPRPRHRDPRRNARPPPPAPPRTHRSRARRPRRALGALHGRVRGARRSGSRERYFFAGRGIVSTPRFGIDLLSHAHRRSSRRPRSPGRRRHGEAWQIWMLSMGISLTASGALCAPDGHRVQRGRHPAHAREREWWSTVGPEIVGCVAGLIAGIPMIYFGTTRFTVRPVEPDQPPRRDAATTIGRRPGPRRPLLVLIAPAAVSRSRPAAGTPPRSPEPPPAPRRSRKPARPPAPPPSLPHEAPPPRAPPRTARRPPSPLPHLQPPPASRPAPRPPSPAPVTRPGRSRARSPPRSPPRPSPRPSPWRPAPAPDRGSRRASRAPSR